MKRSKYTEEQIAFALKQAELGTAVPEVCRKMGVSEATFYNWKKKFGGLVPRSCDDLASLKRNAIDSSACSRTCRWTRLCCRTFLQKSFEAFAAPRTRG